MQKSMSTKEISAKTLKSTIWMQERIANSLKAVTDKKFVKIGKIGDNLAFMFNNEAGFRVQFCGSPQKTSKQNVKFSSQQLIEFIFTEITQEKDRKEFSYTKISDDILIFNPKTIAK